MEEQANPIMNWHGILLASPLINLGYPREQMVVVYLTVGRLRQKAISHSMPSSLPCPAPCKYKIGRAHV